MATLEGDIKKEIKAYVEECGGTKTQWYVGIATDARDRLFNDHNVNEDNDYWIYRIASSDTISRRVEKHFLDLGYDGGDGGGDENTKSVYAYRKTSNTKE